MRTDDLRAATPTWKGAGLYRAIPVLVLNTGEDPYTALPSDYHDREANSMVTITRDTQQPYVIYARPDGSCFVTPDGDGRFYFDTVREAQDECGDDLPIRHIHDWTEN